MQATVGDHPKYDFFSRSLRILLEIPEFTFDTVTLLELAKLFNHQEVINFLQTCDELSIRAVVDQNTTVGATGDNEFSVAELRKKIDSISVNSMKDGESCAPKEEKENSITDHRKVCWSCHAPEEEGRQLSRCRGCRRARYCDQECQAADWDRHSGYCVEKQEKKKKIK